MNPNHESDDQDSFGQYFEELRRIPVPRADLADSIFEQTRGVLTHRRWYRRGRVAAICVGCYIVGICSGWALKPETEPLVALHTTNRSDEVVSSRLDSREKQNVLNTVATGANESVRQVVVTQGKTHSSGVERSAFPGTATSGIKASVNASVPKATSQFENFRRAGDLQLFERGNVGIAIECYRRALTHATDHELNVQIDQDSWLLMSLKQSRIGERKHVRHKRA
jgi:hypothetical protein